jgi:hypothetical protein
MPSRNELRGIARRAMIRRGLLAEFSPAIKAETNATRKPSPRRALPSAISAACFGPRSTTRHERNRQHGQGDEDPFCPCRSLALHSEP